MAAPAEKTTKDLSGNWVMNKSLSDSTEPALALQGIGFLIRKPVSYATITLDVTQYTAPPKPPATGTDIVTHIDITQSASGLSSTQENRCLDNEFREHSDWLFGDVKGRSQWISLDEVEDAFLKKDWLIEGEGKNLILSHVESQGNGWTATQVWGFQNINDERRYVRHVLVKKGDKRVEVRFVYDFVS
ncbi:Fc.00g068610.m01.CDS01 [Cosmosporella sp. VM-42]